MITRALILAGEVLAEFAERALTVADNAVQAQVRSTGKRSKLDRMADEILARADQPTLLPPALMRPTPMPPRRAEQERLYVEACAAHWVETSTDGELCDWNPGRDCRDGDGTAAPSVGAVAR